MTNDLFEVAISSVDQDEEVCERAIEELRSQRCTPSVFKRASQLARSESHTHAIVGVRVLSDFGARLNFPFRAESVAPLLAALSKNDISLQCLAINALGKGGPASAQEPVLAMMGHADSRIRLAVAQAIPSFVDESVAESDPAIQALIVMIGDSDPKVRDWATFGLGSQTVAMGKTVSTALFCRLDDDDANTRYEALVGLARRRDRRAVPALLLALDADFVASLAIEAAEYLAAPEAHGALLDLAKSEDWHDEVTFALKRSSTDAQRALSDNLHRFLRLAEAREFPVACFSERCPHDSGGPQISFKVGDGYHGWSFEELLDNADGNVEAIVERIASRAAADQLKPGYRG